MTPQFRLWLPDGVAVPAAVEGAIADAVEGWSRKWFARGALRPAGRLARIAEAKWALTSATWHALDDGVALGVSEESLSALGAMVLGIGASRSERPQADGELLLRLGSECLDDGKRRLATALKLPADAAWTVADARPNRSGDLYTLEIGGAAKYPLLKLEISSDLLVRLIKRGQPPAPAGAPLDAQATALAKLPVRLSALLGRCGVTIAELEALAPGDVLVLDRALVAPLPLAINGALVPRGACAIAEAGDTVAIKITESIAA